jgi:hypothetical protein
MKISHMYLSPKDDGYSTNAAPADQVNDCEQYDSANQRYEEGLYCYYFIDRTAVKNQTSDECTNDAHDDIEEEALLSVSAHDDASKPAHYTAHD